MVVISGSFAYGVKETLKDELNRVDVQWGLRCFSYIFRTKERKKY
jgi:hypothetical protein